MKDVELDLYSFDTHLDSVASKLKECIADILSRLASDGYFKSSQKVHHINPVYCRDIHACCEFLHNQFVVSYPDNVKSTNSLILTHVCW